MAADEDRQDRVITLPASSADAHTRDRLRWLDQVMADRELTSFAFKVAYAIAGHVNRDTGEAWPSQARIAETVGGTERGARAAVEQLAARGHLSISTPNGRKGVNRYRPILTREKAEVVDLHRHGGAGKRRVHGNGHDHEQGRNGHGGAGDGDLHRHGGAGLTVMAMPPNPLSETSEDRTIVETRSTKPRPRRTRSKPDGSGFAEAYELYPRHVAPDAARRAYDKAVGAGAKPEEILAGVRRYAAERAGKDRDYTAHMATWLNAGRWKDGRPPPSEAPIAVPAEVFEVRGRQIPEENIVAAVGRWRRGEGWSDVWGPPPDSPACRIPRPILDRAEAALPPPASTAPHQRQEGASR